MGIVGRVRLFVYNRRPQTNLFIYMERLFLGAAITAVIAGATSSSNAQMLDEPTQLYEQKIKAGLLYNFLKYTSWPRSAGKKLTVCLYGSGSLDDYLYPLKGRTAQQYIISVKNIGDISLVEGCNLIFIHKNKIDILPSILKSIKGKPIMTASEIEDFALRGGMVQFLKKDNRIRIFINNNAAQDVGLKIDNRLIKLSKLVSTRG